MWVSEACQINDLDHEQIPSADLTIVSEACQINDLDHTEFLEILISFVSEACQINDLDHGAYGAQCWDLCFRSLSDQ